MTEKQMAETDGRERMVNMEGTDGRDRWRWRKVESDGRARLIAKTDGSRKEKKTYQRMESGSCSEFPCG